MKQPSPPRLIEDPEFSGPLNHAASDGLTSERLERNGKRVAEAIAALPFVPLSAPIAPLSMKVGLVAMFGAAVGIGLITEPPPAAEVPMHVAETLQVRLSPTNEIASTPVVEDTKLQVALTTATPVPVPPSSVDLAAQLAVYETAEAAAAARDFTLAVTQLDALLADYPDTPLRAEADLSRADWLARAGRDVEAAAQVEKLIADKRHEGRKAELYRLLGDLYLKQDNCEKAVPAYQAVVAMEGPFDEAVQRGLSRCQIE